MNKARIFLAAFGLAFLVIMITSVNRIIEIENSKPIETKTKSSAIDSVWTKSPGEINTMQTDFVYFGRTEDGIIHSSIGTEFHVGDSIQYIYYRYENSKKEKK